MRDLGGEEGRPQLIDARPATDADTPALAAMLVRAFADDPMYRWLLRSPARHERYARRFFGWQLGRLLPQGLVTTNDDTTAAALWALPGRWRESTGEGLRLLAVVAPGMIGHLRSAMRGLATVDERHPLEPHLYLALLGCEPDVQGTGRGSAVLAPGLEQAERDHLPAYLETAVERNVGFYERFGFAVTAELPLPNGPTVWTMWRGAP